MSAICPELEALGVGLAFIGNGSPEAAQDFRTEFRLTVPLYVAPDLRAYEAFGFEHGAASTFAPGVFLNAARALGAGHRQGATAGSAMQQGGIALVRPDGTVPYLFRSKTAGDHPTTAEVLAAVRRAATVPFAVPSPATPTISLETVKALAKAHAMMIAMCWMDGPTVARVTWIPTPKRWPADETSLDTLAKALNPGRALKLSLIHI